VAAEVLYVSGDETRALVGPGDALRLAEQVCHWHVQGQEAWPEPNIMSLRLAEPQAAYRIKMAALTGIPVVGVRVTGYSFAPGGLGSGAPDNTRFVILSDPRTARPLAIVDEHWTYNLRTCASGILALRHLARPDSTVAGLLGAGQLATTCLEMLAREFSLREVRVTSRRPESREAFAARMADRLGVAVEARATAREVVDGTDVVISCTSANSHLIFDGWLEPGATLCALGQDEAHPSVYRSVDKVIVSDLEVVKEATDVRRILRNGEFSEQEVWADLATIVTGRKPGRESPSERILIRASGLVSQDVAMCHFVYQEALRRGLGTRLPVG
jgi:alanine dehydrogenase